eukprot:GHVS01098615.1.p1 GENE.GHVS01098615.1~~GHVS01098615.1.p1  ORF type:complete len:820 (+),score=204.73 GHVS01098615.1:393-2852(+)
MVHLPASKDQFYKTKLCPHHEAGGCRKKVDCFFAHGLDELRIAPDLRKTKLCQDFLKNGSCARGEECMYAHSEKELRFTQGYWKTDICKYWKSGGCTSGAYCRHAHGLEELRPARKHKQDKIENKLAAGSRATPRGRLQSRQQDVGSGGCSNPTTPMGGGAGDFQRGRGSFSMRHCQQQSGRAGRMGKVFSGCCEDGYMTPQPEPTWDNKVMLLPPKGFLMTPLNKRGDGSRARGFGFVTDRVDEVEEEESCVADIPTVGHKEIGLDVAEQQDVKVSDKKPIKTTTVGGGRSHHKILFVGRDDMEDDDDCFGKAVPMDDMMPTPQSCLLLPPPATSTTTTRSSSSLHPPVPLAASYELPSSHSALEDVTVDVMDDDYIDGIGVAGVCSVECTTAPDSNGSMLFGHGGGAVRTVERHTTQQIPKRGGHNNHQASGGCPIIRVISSNGGGYCSSSSTEVLEVATSSSDCTINQPTDVVYCTASTPASIPPPPPHNGSTSSSKYLSHLLPLSKRPSLSVPSPSITCFSRKGRSSTATVQRNFIPPPPKDIPPPPPQMGSIPPPPPLQHHLTQKSTTTASPVPSRCSSRMSHTRSPKPSSQRTVPPPRCSVSSSVCSTVPSRSNSIVSSSSRGYQHVTQQQPFIPPPPVDRVGSSGCSGGGRTLFVSTPSSPCGGASTEHSLLQTTTQLLQAPLSPPVSHRQLYADIATTAAAAWADEGKRTTSNNKTAAVADVQSTISCPSSGYYDGSGCCDAPMVSSSADGGNMYYSYLPVAVDDKGTVMYAPMFMWEKVDSGVPVDLQAKFNMVQYEDLAMSCRTACYVE